MRVGFQRLGRSLLVASLVASASAAAPAPLAPAPGMNPPSGQPSVSGHTPVFAAPAEKRVEEAIRIVLQQQVADWNRGDLEAFAQGYKRSPDILFMSGATIRRGYDSMLGRYKQSYSTRERMGTLSFNNLEVQPLSPRFATVTGRFRLERTAAGGGNAEGFFLLVLEKTPAGWKIVRDDTTAAPKAP